MSSRRGGGFKRVFDRMVGGTQKWATQQWWMLADWEVELYRLSSAPPAEIKRYLSWRAMNTAVRPHLHDSAWEALLANKWIFAVYYSRLNAPVPDVYGLLHPVSGMTVDGRPLQNREDFSNWLQQERLAALVVKPLGGNQGRGVQLIRDIEWRGDHPTLIAVNGRTLSAEDLFNELDNRDYRKLSGHLLQEWLPPHPDMVRLTGTAPHSIRVVTAVLPSGEVDIQLASIRMGFGDAMVDGWNNGGIAGPVNPETGQIGITARKPKFGGADVEVHPDTGARLRGTILPDWAKVREAAKSMARLTPGLRVVGWDVVLSTNGPRIVEGNFDWDLQFVQFGTGGVMGTRVAETWRQLGGDLPDSSVHWRWRHRRRPLAGLARRALRYLER